MLLFFPGMKRASLTLLFYGFLLLVGGVMGKLKGGSTISLTVGTLSGLFFIIASIGLRKNHLFSVYSSLVALVLLDAFFTFRYLYTLSFFPSGLFCLLTLVTLSIAVTFIRKELPRKS